MNYKVFDTYTSLVFYITYLLIYAISPVQLSGSLKIVLLFLLLHGLILFFRTISFNITSTQSIICYLIIFLFFYTCFTTLSAYNAEIAFRHLFGLKGGLFVAFFLFMAISHIIVSADTNPNNYVVLMFIGVNIIIFILLSKYAVGGLKFSNTSYQNLVIGSKYQPIADTFVVFYTFTTLLILRLTEKSSEIFRHIISMSVIIIGFGYVLLFQFIGSNAGSVLIFYLTICFLFIIFVKSKNPTRFLFICYFVALIAYFPLDFTTFLQLKIFNFGTESSLISTSLSARFNIIKDSLALMNINPWWGHMRAEIFVSGSGKFPHSLIISLISHTGILGLSIFSIIMIFTFTEIRLYAKITNSPIYWLLLLYFVGVFCFALIAKFWTWTPLIFFITLAIQMRLNNEDR